MNLKGNKVCSDSDYEMKIKTINSSLRVLDGERFDEKFLKRKKEKLLREPEPKKPKIEPKPEIVEQKEEVKETKTAVKEAPIKKIRKPKFKVTVNPSKNLQKEPPKEEEIEKW